MKKYIIPIVVVVAFGVYVLLTWQKSVNVAMPPANATTDGSSTATSQSATTIVTAATSTSGASSSAYRDGSYTGTVANAFYGNLQIAVTISGGKITDINWPVYPNESGHTQQVSETALPTLKQEAIAAQSAQVNIVSGATQTSEAFQQSLAAALAMAK